MTKEYMKEVTFVSKDGIKLVGIWHIPEKAMARVVILAHGITSDKDEDGIFVDLANKLQENDFVVFRFDFRGHGESGGRSVDMTIAGELLDMEAAFEEVKSKGYKEIGLLGASFGGGVAALYTAKNQDKIKALSLWNPCLDYDHTFLNPITPWLKKRKAQMDTDLKEKGWMRIGSKKFKVGKQVFEEMKELFPYKELKKISIPVSIVHGTVDKYVSHQDSIEYIENVQGEKELIIIKGATHGFHDRKEDSDKAVKETVVFFISKL